VYADATATRLVGETICRDVKQRRTSRQSREKSARRQRVCPRRYTNLPLTCSRHRADIRTNVRDAVSRERGYARKREKWLRATSDGNELERRTRQTVTEHEDGTSVHESARAAAQRAGDYGARARLRLVHAAFIMPQS